ncbi:MAG TPA: TetR/AcrR family transcriptional regulator [Capsulimonadaceae bacterium]|jgi:AcrR family transcriptional regulator
MSTKRDEQRDRLLRAAYELIAEVGISGLRTRDIADKAGVNIATLHYCFATKDALLTELYSYIIAMVKEERARYINDHGTAADKLRGHSELRLHFLRDKPASARAWRAFSEGVWTNGAVREIMRRHFAEVRVKLRDIIAEGRRDGTIGPLPTDDDDLAASMLMSLYDGLIFQWVADPEGFPIEQYTSGVLAWLGLQPVPEVAV